MDVILDSVHLKAICDILANNLTHSKIDRYLAFSNIQNKGIPTTSNGYSYKIGSNKTDKIYNSLSSEMNKTKSTKPLITFLENICTPANYTDFSNREGYKTLVSDLNKVLLLLGREINEQGKFTRVSKASTLDEVDERLKSFKNEIDKRNMHYMVKKYCSREYLKEDYFHAISESVKGVCDRIRNITNLTEDGTKLINKSFSTKDPFIILNSLQTESERSEYIGLAKLIEGLNMMIRNVTAHTPRIKWEVDEKLALEVFNIVSFIHRYLDECIKNPQKI